MSDDLKIRMPEWARHMYNRLVALINAGGGGGGGGEENVIESISLNGVNVPPDANKNVALEESDPTVPSWAKQSSKPTYTAQEVGALPASTPIPTKTSDLTNDSGFLTSSTGVSGVKGNAESSYRQGNVNLTPANIGAAPYYYIRNTADDRRLQFDTNGINLWSYEAGSWSAKNIINNQGDILDYYYNDSNEHVIGKFGSYTLYRNIFTRNGYSDNAETFLGYINGTPINVYGIYTQNDGSRVAANHYYDGSSYSSLWVGANNYVYGRAHPAGTYMIAIVEYYR